ncbi:unnamed protein product [Arctia plantaginis]|uniref:Uncharacterized protein n=1 Tax=Arctia plantaginis TaxID=874455 RepID=A0A8S0Z712_ARCPL|nr:unnamed protein product [Arctia plantaginis]
MLNFKKLHYKFQRKQWYFQKNTIVLANSRHLMEDDQPQASTSKISEDRDDCSSVTTLTSMDSETARELCLSNSIKNAFERISSNKAGENGQMCMYYLATQLAHGHKKKKKSHQEMKFLFIYQIQ